MKRCETIREDLKAYLDGELAFRERMAVRRHLLGCATCRGEIAAMKQIGNELRLGDTGELDPALRARILAIPEMRPEAAASTLVARSVRRRQPRLLLICGAAIVGGLAGLFVLPTFLPAHEAAKQLRRSVPDRVEFKFGATTSRSAPAAIVPMMQQKAVGDSSRQPSISTDEKIQTQSPAPASLQGVPTAGTVETHSQPISKRTGQAVEDSAVSLPSKAFPPASSTSNPRPSESRFVAAKSPAKKEHARKPYGQTHGAFGSVRPGGTPPRPAPQNAPLSSH